MDAASLNKRAQEFKALHRPGHPVILANVYDIPSAQAVAGIPSCKALATASYAVALVHGVDDETLSLETNLAAVEGISSVARQHDKPLTVDLQHGYGDQLEQAIRGVIQCGAVGANLEDTDRDSGAQQLLFDPSLAVERIRRALTAAREAGVPDFVINARCDVLLMGQKGTGDMVEETIRRGKMYLAAGATSVFVLGGSQRGGLGGDEIKRLSEAFEGRLNVSCVLGEPGKLNVQEVAALGVSRISVGPQLLVKAVEAVKREAETLLNGLSQ